jgi:hypothetical protein
MTLLNLIESSFKTLSSSRIVVIHVVGAKKSMSLLS